VVVPGVPINLTPPGFGAEKTVGRFAYGVGDQGVKASLGLPDRSGEVDYPPWVTSVVDDQRSRIRQQIATAPGYFRNVAGERCGFDPLAPGNDPRRSRLLELSQCQFMTPVAPAAPMGAFLREHYHDFTVRAAAVLANGADLGVAWDGDFDRCFFFDHTGAFVDGEYIVGLLAATFLAKEHGARIVHDPRVVWNTQDIVAAQGGVAVQSRTGHAFVKQVMRDTGAVYGGEMSAHHYFRDFSYCDSGMIPFLLISELISRQGALADLVAGRKAAFPSSGEINFRLPNAAASLERVREMFEPLAETVDETDGLSLSFGDWRMNLRSSNTEPLVRLNIESRGNADLLPQKLALISKVLQEG
jgi:hypothetical protein